MGKTRTLGTLVSTGQPLEGGQTVVSKTAITTNGQASYEFTDIPAWAKSIKLIFRNVSTSGTAGVQLKLGTSGGIVTSGYAGTLHILDGTSASATGALTDAFLLTGSSSTLDYSGVIELVEIGANVWVHRSHLGAGGSRSHISVGELSLGAELTTVRIAVGVGTFDGGTINIQYQ